MKAFLILIGLIHTCFALYENIDKLLVAADPLPIKALFVYDENSGAIFVAKDSIVGAAYTVTILKYDLLGNLIYTKYFGGASLEDSITSLIVSPSGVLYVGGQTSRAWKDPSKQFPCAFLVAIRIDGTVLFEKFYGTSFGFQIYSLSLSGKNGLVASMARDYQGSVYFINPDTGTETLIIPAGVYGFRTINKHFETDSHLYIAGILHGPLDLADSIFIAKYDFSGNQVWIRRWLTGVSADLTGLAVDENAGKVFAVGNARAPLFRVATVDDVSQKNDVILIGLNADSGNEIFRQQSNFEGSCTAGDILLYPSLQQVHFAVSNYLSSQTPIYRGLIGISSYTGTLMFNVPPLLSPTGFSTLKCQRYNGKSVAFLAGFGQCYFFRYANELDSPCQIVTSSASTNIARLTSSISSPFVVSASRSFSTNRLVSTGGLLSTTRLATTMSESLPPTRLAPTGGGGQISFQNSEASSQTTSKTTSGIVSIVIFGGSVSSKTLSSQEQNGNLVSDSDLALSSTSDSNFSGEISSDLNTEAITLTDIYRISILKYRQKSSSLAEQKPLPNEFSLFSRTTVLKQILLILAFIVLIAVFSVCIYLVFKGKRNRASGAFVKSPSKNMLETSFSFDDTSVMSQMAPKTSMASPSYHSMHTIKKSHYEASLTERSVTLIAGDNVLAVPGFLAAQIGLDYSINSSIAKGGGGEVFIGQAQRPQFQNYGKTIIVKKIIHSDGDHQMEMKKFHLELSITAYLQKSKYVVKLVGYSESPLALLLKLYPRGSLAAWAKKNPHAPVRTKLLFMCDIARGLKDIHQSGFVHADLKPDNVLVDIDERTQVLFCVLTDFGLAQVVDKSVMQVRQFVPVNRAGISLMFAAPEVFEIFRVPLYQRDYPSDVYAFGILGMVILNERL